MGEDVRDLLMDPLSRRIPASQVWGVADALLPVVQALMAKGKAEALEQMAEVFDADARHTIGGETYGQAAEDCRTEAAALRATTSGEGR